METLIKNIEVVEAKLRILSETLKAIHKFQKDSHKLSSIIAGDDGVDAALRAGRTASARPPRPREHAPD